MYVIFVLSPHCLQKLKKIKQNIPKPFKKFTNCKDIFPWLKSIQLRLKEKQENDQMNQLYVFFITYCSHSFLLWLEKFIVCIKYFMQWAYYQIFQIIVRQKNWLAIW